MASKSAARLSLHASLLIPGLFILTAFAIFWPYIHSGFALDDFFWISIFEEHIPFRRWVGLWDVDATTFRAFQNVWWTDATTDIGRFWRPVFSLTMEGAFRIFGRASAAPLHILAILLHAMVALTAARMLALVTKERMVSLFAAGLYLISEDHSMTVGWISTSTDLFAVLFMNLSVILYIQHRESGRIGRLILSLLSFCLAMGSKETAIVTPAAIILYETLSDEGMSPFSRIHRLRSSFRSWGWHVLLVAVFLLAYRSLGFGARSLAYYDPLKNPFEYLAHAAQGMGILFTGWLTPAPIGFTLFLGSAQLPAALAGWALFSLVIIALWPLRKEPGVRWALLLFLGASLPQLSADASERQLYYPMIPGCYLLARLVFQWPSLARRYMSGQTIPGIVRGRILPISVLISAGVVALALSVYYSFMYRDSLTSTHRRAMEASVLFSHDTDAPVIFLNSPDPFFPMYVSDSLRYHEGRYRQVYPLSGFYGRIEAKATGRDAFALRTDSPGWLSNMFARIPRQSKHVLPHYDRPAFTATPVRTTTLPDGVQDVFEVEFRLRPDSPATILYFDGRRWQTWTGLHAGQTDWQLLADTGDVLKAMSE